MQKLLHPITGEPALGVRKDGRPIFAIRGADENGDAAIVTRLAELDEQIETARNEIVGFADIAELDDTQTARFAELETQIETLTAEREPIAHRAEVIHRVRGLQRRGVGLEHIGNGPQVQTRVQPFADLDRVADRSVALEDVRSRALAAVEQAPHLEDDQRERAEALLRRNDRHGRIARHMLLTGSPEYERAFEALLCGRQPWQLTGDVARALAFADEHMRAMNEGSNGAGGYAVPFYLDPTIILTNAGSTNPFRQISRVEAITTNAWHGLSSAGVTASYRGEATETSDASPTLGQPTVNLAKADAYLQASFELMQDTSVTASFGMLLADAKDNFEATEFAVGDGTTGHITGVVTAVNAAGGSNVVTSATAATYAIGDVWKLRNSIPARFRKGASWVAEQNIFDLTRQFATGTGQQSGAFWADLGMDTPSLLIGKPVHESSAMASTVASGNKILLAGDFKQGYLIVDRIGMTVQYEPLVKGTNGRPTGEAGWYAYWRVGANAILLNALRLLKVQ